MKNYLQNIALVGTTIAALALTACRETRTELSDVLHEDATVSETVYTPSSHGTGVSPTFHLDGEGNINPGIAVTSVDIPEKYAVVFKCQHGKFISEGTDARHKDLWGRLEQGQQVDVTYRETYTAEYDDLDGDGKNDLVSRTLVGYDFLDAQPKKLLPERESQ